MGWLGGFISRHPTLSLLLITVRVTRHVQLHSDKCIPWGERTACLTVVAISGGWMLFCMAEDGHHTTMQRTTWRCQANSVVSSQPLGVKPTCWCQANSVVSSQLSGVKPTRWCQANFLVSSQLAGVKPTCWCQANLLVSSQLAGVKPTCWCQAREETLLSWRVHSL